ncbi:hypothetical protein JCM8115_002357 [Rhodotorula mucilaginosa]
MTEPAIDSPTKTTTRGLRFWVIIAALLLATFEAAVEQTALSTALPTIAKDLDSDDPSWIANVFMIASAAAIPWSGGCAQIFGRKGVFLAGVGGFALGSIICAVAKTSTQMLAGRGIQGAGGGIIFAIVEIILSDMVPLAERGLYQGMFSAIWSIASACGPLLGGAFASFNYRLLFWINVPISFICALVCIFFMQLKGPEDNMREKLKKMDWLGNLIFIPSISVLILGLVWGGADYPWRSAHVIATIVCGAAGLVLWVVVEKRYVANPTVPFEAMMKKTCVIGLLTTGLHGIVAMAVLYCWPAYFQSAKAESVIRSSIDYLPVALLISPFAMGTGISVNILGTYKAQNIIGWVIITVGVGLLALTKETTSTVGWVLIPMIVAIGIGIDYAAPVYPVLAPLPPSIAGQALAFQMLVRTFGNVLGISVGLTAMTNMLGQKLPREYLDMVPNGVTGAYASIPMIPDLEEPLKLEVRRAFAQSLRVVWLVMIPIAGIGLLLSCFMESLPLTTETDETFGMKRQVASDAERDQEKQNLAIGDEPAPTLPNSELQPTLLYPISSIEATTRTMA